MNICERNRISYQPWLVPQMTPDVGLSLNITYEKTLVIVTIHHVESKLPCVSIGHLVFNICPALKILF